MADEETAGKAEGKTETRPLTEAEQVLQERWQEASREALHRDTHPQALVSQEIARLFIDYARYDRDNEEWKTWGTTRDTAYWRGKDEGANESVFNMIKGFVIYLANGSRGVKPPERKSMMSLRYMRDIEGFLRRTPALAVPARFWDADPFLLGTPEGTIDLRTGELLKADPGNYISKLIRYSVAPEGTPTPRWSLFLDQVTKGDKELQRLLRMWAGVGASGTSRDQKFMFIYGPGGNGKGVFLRVIARILGPYHTMADPDLLVSRPNSSPQHSTGLAKIMQARFVSATEVPSGANWNLPVIKAFSGGDTVTARFLYQNFQDFEPRCTVTISGNDKPALEGIDHAIRRRFMLVEFPEIFRNPILDLDAQLLAAEGPGIARWIVDGAVDRERAGELIIPASVTAASEAYFSEEDLIRRFLQEQCERDERPIAEQEAVPWQVGSTELFEAWKAFAMALGRRPGSHTSFTTKVKTEKGVGYAHTKRGNVFTEIRLRTTYGP